MAVPAAHPPWLTVSAPFGPGAGRAVRPGEPQLRAGDRQGRRSVYINALVRAGALATRNYAIAHPSLPNYIALAGGSVFGIRHDCAACDADGQTSIVGQLDATGRTWKAYFEDLGSNRQPGAVTRQYDPHYNPFVYDEDCGDLCASKAGGKSK